MDNKIKDMIREFIGHYPEKKGFKTKWKEPLVAYANADNEMFYELKKIVGETHALPKDFLQDAKTVITYFIPFDQTIIKSNIGGRESSKLWALAYIETNQLIADLNTFINEELKKIGFNSSIIPATHNFDEKKLISDWSHRHVAFIAGLGSFGLNNMLITEKGTCGRIGSIVTNINIEPSKQTNKEYCLYKFNGTCKKCIERCVNTALTIDGFDRHKCYEMCLNNNKIHSDMGLTDVCGKCLVGLPCSTSNPLSNI